MSGKDADQAARKSHPVAAADASGRTGVYRFALTTANQSIALPTIVPGPTPAGIEGRFVEVKCVSASGAAVQYAFSVAAQALVLNQLSSFASPSAAAGATLANGEGRDGRIPQVMKYINFIGSAAATTGDFIEVHVSECGS